MALTAHIDTMGIKEGNCILPVCACCMDLRSKKFLTYAREAAKTFSKAHIVLCDTLDAHNYTDEDAPNWQEVREITRGYAATWFQKHESKLEEAFEQGITVLHWDEIRNDKSFAEKSRVVQRLYADNADCKRYIDDIVNYIVNEKAKRAQNQGFTPDLDTLHRRSLAYLMEEIPGTVIYQERYKAPVVYSGVYFDDPQFFNRMRLKGEPDMTLPLWCPAKFTQDLPLAA
ncbi:hypothetical protein [Parvularcula marina]|uniref:hypothetical protein n=1 Tax=Parvularcula marina TaxID=2292771 RepID=UPI0035170D2C